MDINIEIFKNNPSLLSFLCSNSFFPNKKDIIVSPGCVFAIKYIIPDPNGGSLNVIYSEFLGNFFNPYDYIKFSSNQHLQFNELNVENQKNKFKLSQEKILEYFSEAINYNKSIRSLDISNNKIIDISLNHLVNCFKKSNLLVVLNLSNNALSEKSGPILEEILNYNVNLEILNLSNTNLTDIGIEALTNCLIVNKCIKNLDLSKNSISYIGAAELKKVLSINNTLEVLNVAANKLDDMLGNQPIIEALSVNSTLKEIDLTECNLNEKTLINLFEILKKNSSLKILKLNQNEFNENALIEMNMLMSKFEYQINSISLSGISFSEITCKYLGDNLRKNNFLKVIKLSNNNINEKSMEYLMESLKHNTKIEEIDLSYNYVGKQILHMLTNLLEVNRFIKKISLKGNFIYDKMKDNFDRLKNIIKENNIETDLLIFFP